MSGGSTARMRDIRDVVGFRSAVHDGETAESAGNSPHDEWSATQKAKDLLQA
jgi:hypothetical protein